MDANGLGFWMLSEAEHYRLLGDPSGVEYDAGRRCLRLASQQLEQNFVDFEAQAIERLGRVPRALDGYGNWLYWDEESRSLIASGAMAGELEIYSWPVPEDDTPALSPTDIAMGYDGVLYIAVGDEIIMHDRRERWDDVGISLPGFSPWRIAADPRGGIWVLDRDSLQLARLQGQPLPKRLLPIREDEEPRPCEENPSPPRLLAVAGVEWSETESPVAIAVNTHGRVALLSWVDAGNAVVRFVQRASDTGLLQLSQSLELLGIVHPYSMAWVNHDRLALLLAGVTDRVPVVSAAGDLPAKKWPVGELYPLKSDFSNGPFMHNLGSACHYPVVSEDPILAHRELHKLSFPFYATQGEANQNPATAPLDSKTPGTVWHRLYIEAVIPKDCGIRVWLASVDEACDPGDISGKHTWHEHRFGDIYRGNAVAERPIGAWESIASEIPHHPGLLPCGIEENRSGLFSVLVQRTGWQVSRLRGRYLHVHIEMTGSGRTTPEIYALRCYGSRFSYVQEYLPQLYHETLSELDCDAEGSATPADFMERYVANFEGLLTNIEDRIANAHLLTDPLTVPEDSLEWLANWIGFHFEEAYSTTQRRRLLDVAPDLYRWRGTLRGLKLSLEIATSGGITGGEIVVIEDFRLRRTFATIIGADLADGDDPLTTGALISGNSFVGDTLFVGDEMKQEFLALFAADLAVNELQSSAIDELFDHLAHRVTILVHNEVTEQDMGLIRRVTEREVPAHVEYQVISASYSFLVGMASLVGVDTYLGLSKPPQPVIINKTIIGQGDFISGPAALDPRLAGIGSGRPLPPARPPVAFAPDVTASFGADVNLDGAGSRAFDGRSIRTYNWNINEEI